MVIGVRCAHVAHGRITLTLRYAGHTPAAPPIDGAWWQLHVTLDAPDARAPGASPRIGWLGLARLHDFNTRSHIPLKLQRVGRRRSAGRAEALPSETRGKFPLLIP